MRTLKHTIQLSNDKRHKASLWCKEKFGHSYWAGNQEGIWQTSPNYASNWGKCLFCFEYERDAILFALRWS
jgi:hypothetical protein